MIKSCSIFIKSIAVIAFLLVTFNTTSTVSFASERVDAPEPTRLSTLSVETPTVNYLSDVQDLLVIPLNTNSLLPRVSVDPNSKTSEVTPQSVLGPIWVNADWQVTKHDDGVTVTAVWTIKTDSIIRSVNASFNTGGSWTTPESFTGPNTGGVTLSKTWTYSKPGTYSVGGVAQILTDAGPASCFVGPRVVVIF